jgi:hypothetical protein
MVSDCPQHPEAVKPTTCGDGKEPAHDALHAELHRHMHPKKRPHVHPRVPTSIIAGVLSQVRPSDLLPGSWPDSPKGETQVGDEDARPPELLFERSGDKYSVARPPGIGEWNHGTGMNREENGIYRRSSKVSDGNGTQTYTYSGELSNCGLLKHLPFEPGCTTFNAQESIKNGKLVESSVIYGSAIDITFKTGTSSNMISNVKSINTRFDGSAYESTVSTSDGHQYVFTTNKYGTTDAPTVKY